MKNPWILFFLLLCNCHMEAQDLKVVSTAGESYQGNTLRIDWTIGELAIKSLQNPSQQITQGFQQPNYSITSVEQLPKELGEIKIFPNPVSEKIEMRLNFTKSKKVKIHLIDMHGKLIWFKEANGLYLEEQFALSHLPTATYILSVFIDEEHMYRDSKFKRYKNETASFLLYVNAV